MGNLEDVELLEANIVERQEESDIEVLLPKLRVICRRPRTEEELAEDESLRDLEAMSKKLIIQEEYRNKAMDLKIEVRSTIKTDVEIELELEQGAFSSGQCYVIIVQCNNEDFPLLCDVIPQFCDDNSGDIASPSTMDGEQNSGSGENEPEYSISTTVTIPSFTAEDGEEDLLKPSISAGVWKASSRAQMKTHSRRETSTTNGNNDRFKKGRSKRKRMKLHWKMRQELERILEAALAGQAENTQNCEKSIQDVPKSPEVKTANIEHSLPSLPEASDYANHAESYSTNYYSAPEESNSSACSAEEMEVAGGTNAIVSSKKIGGFRGRRGIRQPKKPHWKTALKQKKEQEAAAAREAEFLAYLSIPDEKEVETCIHEVMEILLPGICMNEDEVQQQQEQQQKNRRNKEVLVVGEEYYKLIEAIEFLVRCKMLPDSISNSNPGLVFEKSDRNNQKEPTEEIIIVDSDAETDPMYFEDREVDSLLEIDEIQSQEDNLETFDEPGEKQHPSLFLPEFPELSDEPSESAPTASWNQSAFVADQDRRSFGYKHGTSCILRPSMSPSYFFKGGEEPDEEAGINKNGFKEQVADGGDHLTLHYCENMETPNVCGFCGSLFLSEALLKTHFKKHEHTKSTTDSAPKRAKFECTVCDETFVDEGLLLLHQRRQECPKCEKSFHCLHAALDHEFIHLPPSMSFKCRSCKRGFSTSAEAAAHVQVENARINELVMKASKEIIWKPKSDPHLHERIV